MITFFTVKLMLKKNHQQHMEVVGCIVSPTYRNIPFSYAYLSHTQADLHLSLVSLLFTLQLLLHVLHCDDCCHEAA